MLVPNLSAKLLAERYRSARFRSRTQSSKPALLAIEDRFNAIVKALEERVYVLSLF